MDFTREPIIETVITPKEGCKLVVRCSKSTGQEEYFVDAVEVISFGTAIFFRSLERPKPFLVPAADYEILEVREARMVLKNVGIERTIKIGGGRAAKESQSSERIEQPSFEASAELGEGKIERRRDKRRQSRRKRGREEEETVDREMQPSKMVENGFSHAVAASGEERASVSLPATPPYSSTILAPPSTLISESIARYRDNAMFKGAFYAKEEAEEGGSEASGETPPNHSEDNLEAFNMENIQLSASEHGSLDITEEERHWILPLSEEKSRSEQEEKE